MMYLVRLFCDRLIVVDMCNRSVHQLVHNTIASSQPVVQVPCYLPVVGERLLGAMSASYTRYVRMLVYGGAS